MSSAGRPQPPSMGGAAPPITVSVEGVEVVQAIQDESNSVTLVAEKPTVARIYLRTESSSALQVRGELRVSRAGAATIDVVSLNTAMVDPADNGDLLKKRHDIQLGLHFQLPAALISAGTTTIELIAVYNVLTGSALALTPATPKSFDFVKGPPLRLRLLGIRYKLAGGTQTFVPRQLDVDLILSWLARAYPVPRADATYAVVDSNVDWPFTATDVNMQLAAIRSADVAAGTDPRTHYYGIVDDGNGLQFMRGRAAGIPASADPSVVASGPTGALTWGWDFDGSYGDWYTGHELGHTFGRFHPGHCNGNSTDDPAFPYPNGQLSGTSPSYVGFDLGDNGVGISPAALPGGDWHDVMTYCEKQWLSAYTYEGIRKRLLEEDSLFATPGAVSGIAPTPTTTAAAMSPTPQPQISIIGFVNLDNKTGSIRYVQPVPAAFQAAAAGQYQATLIVKDRSGQILSETKVPLSLESCSDAGGEPRIGILNAVVPSAPDAAQVELWFEDRKVDTFSAGPVPTSVANIRRLPALGATAPTAAAEIAWDSAEASDPGVTYTVQVRPDPRNSWQTIAVGRPTPEVSIDASQYPPKQRLQVRVIATNGFTTTDVTESEIELD